MANRFAEMWRWQGTVGRVRYALIGFCAFAAKFLVDRAVAGDVFHRAWPPWSYLIFPLRPYSTVVGARPDDAAFAATMLAIATPFIWFGVTLTVQRLRDAGQPLWLAVLFFVPAINLLFLLMLCVIDRNPQPFERQAAPWPETKGLERWIPRSKIGAGLVSVAVAVAAGLIFAVVGIQVLKTYGIGLFVAAPFCLGLLSVLVYSYHEPRSFVQCLTVSLVPIALIGGALVIVAMEGLICIAMAAPFAVALAAFGGALGFAIQAGYRRTKQAPAVLGVVLLFAPSFSTLEHLAKPQPGTFVVKSRIEVNARPETVWQKVVAFGEIAPPKEMLFRAGIAYPIRAEMIGSGPGAERHCVFSTGPFVEPIEVWDEPWLLRFGVASNPPPLNELTPYGHIQPPHLHGYFVSKQGQFALKELPGGRTLLEGTTWYQHTMWPETYWRLWSDYTIHRIHMRVLEHIRAEAERN